MTLRVVKVALIFAVALYYSLVVFNNLTDYDSNYQFVRHVLMMDSTFPGNHGMWRALDAPAVHTLFYLAIIAWEAAATALCWWGGIAMARSLREPPAVFHRAKRVAILGIALGLLLWFSAFLTIGGEWFLMWQSKTSNGADSAGRIFEATGIVLIFVSLADADDQP
jgi:predicted small integral membrane protein